MNRDLTQLTNLELMQYYHEVLPKDHAEGLRVFREWKRRKLERKHNERGNQHGKETR